MFRHSQWERNVPANHRCSHSGTAPGLAAQWKVLMQKHRLLHDAPHPSFTKTNSHRWMTCYGNLKTKLQQRYHHYISSKSQKNLKRCVCVALIMSQPQQHKHPRWELQARHAANCWTITSFLLSVPLFSFFMTLRNITRSIVLYHKHNLLKKNARIYIFLDHIRCENVFRSFLFKYFPWVEKRYHAVKAIPAAHICNFYPRVQPHCHPGLSSQ